MYAGNCQRSQGRNTGENQTGESGTQGNYWCSYDRSREVKKKEAINGSS